jgi:hypothetical protein
MIVVFPALPRTGIKTDEHDPLLFMPPVLLRRGGSRFFNLLGKNRLNPKGKKYQEEKRTF